MHRFVGMVVATFGMALAWAQSIVMPDNLHPYLPDKARFDIEGNPSRAVITTYRVRPSADTLQKRGVRRVLALEFDDHGNLRTYRRKSRRGETIRTYRYTYGPHGPIKAEVAEENGVPREFRQYDYDDEGRLRTVEIFDRYRRPVATFHYKWKDGRIRKEAFKHQDAVLNRTTTFEYDEEGRLVEETIRRSEGTIRTRYTYRNGRLHQMIITSPDGASLQRTFSYDAEGRKSRVQEIEGPDTSEIQYFYHPGAVDWWRQTRKGRRPHIIERRIE